MALPGLKTEFPGLFDVMSHHFDEVLEALWADHKKNGFDRQSFWQTWRSAGLNDRTSIAYCQAKVPPRSKRELTENIYLTSSM